MCLLALCWVVAGGAAFDVGDSVSNDIDFKLSTKVTLAVSWGFCEPAAAFVPHSLKLSRTP